ncbi:MAG TPA: bifunctional 5,10-methylenetetrahydrofolate dehydrogenase/5,10-methenyltetrahydrofolate cyclohydrolase, partial [Phycisphaerae bacterium]|nr:bifunctional 5,10-methylenetetrahydrofolate dehydrogenase/5,10-methenyltetrahydrofolate cyclohydrolase [Phycisphaerae bacterium]
MAAKIIDGKALAATIEHQVLLDVKKLNSAGYPVTLSAILVGHSPAARVYAQNQARTCEKMDIAYKLHELPENVSQTEIDALLQKLALDKTVTGIMVHLPLPEHLNTQQTQFAIDVIKDVEGVNPANLGHVLYGHPIIAPCTALAALALIEATGAALTGAEVTVVGASRIAGRPV